MTTQPEKTDEIKVDERVLEPANLIWDEYKYRHELCWNLIFKITLVTATLSIIPYLNNDIIPQAELLVFITPLIGIGVSAIGGFRLYRELRLLDKIRNLHRVFQNNVYGELYNKLFRKPLHKLEESNFTLHVTIYIIILNCLALLNLIIMSFYFLGSFLNWMTKI